MGEVLGIDVSHHNGKIDWKQVAVSGKKFAMPCSSVYKRSYEERW